MVWQLVARPIKFQNQYPHHQLRRRDNGWNPYRPWNNSMEEGCCFQIKNFLQCSNLNCQHTHSPYSSKRYFNHISLGERRQVLFEISIPPFVRGKDNRKKRLWMEIWLVTLINKIINSLGELQGYSNYKFKLEKERCSTRLDFPHMSLR